MHGIRPATTPHPLDMMEDHHPDPDDVGEFNFPDQQTLMIDAFMKGLCKEAKMTSAALQHFLPDCQIRVSVMDRSWQWPLLRQESAVKYLKLQRKQAFSSSEMKLYKHSTAYKWTADELIAAINLIKSADFKVEDVNVDLHKRVAAANTRYCKGTFHESQHAWKRSGWRSRHLIL